MNSIIKLTNGETIIAEIVHQDDKTTSVLEPLQLIIEESTDNGRPIMLALNWIPLTKKINLVELKTNHVVAIAQCDEEIDRYYIRSLSVLKGEKKEIEWDEDELNESELFEFSNTTNTMVH